MQITRLHGNVAEIESEFGTYLIQFESDEEGNVSKGWVLDFENTAQFNFETDSAHLPLPPSDDVVIQTALSLIEDHIQDLIEAGVYDNGSKQSSPELESVVMVCTQSGRFEIMFSTQIPPGSYWFDLFTGEPALVAQLIGPLKSLLRAYTRFTPTTDEDFAYQYMSNVVRSIVRLWETDLMEHGFAEEIPTMQQLSKLEKTGAAIAVALNVLKSAETINNAFLKYSIKSGYDLSWYKLRKQQRRSFDLDRFKADHPDLYEEYVSNSEVEYLTKILAPKNSPIDDSTVQSQVNAAVDLFQKSIF